jgi:hypothetical protein
MKITKRIKLLAAALLVTLGLGGSAVGISYAATSQKAQAADVEANDDSATNGKATQDSSKDGETNDDSKSTATSTNVQDNGQDGEINDTSNQ